MSKLTLEERLSAIGVMTTSRNLFKKERDLVDIERTLADFFVLLAESEDAIRLLSPVFSWIEHHAQYVIVEKLLKILNELKASGDDASFAALAGRFAVKNGFRNWAKLSTLVGPKPKSVGPAELAASLVLLRGEEEWSKGCGVILPKGVLETNSKWTLQREALAKINRQYRNRLIYGTQARADIITAVELGARTPAQAVRLSGASYEPCHRVMSDLIAAGKIRTV